MGSIDIELAPLVVDVLLSTILLIAVASITWELVWPRWKLVAKIIVHPCIYALMSIYIGHWTILLAWIHQGVLGLGAHIWFCRKHGFTWYSVEAPDRYIEISKEAVNSITKFRSETSHLER